MAIVAACDENKLPAEPALLISNNVDAAVLTWGKEKGILTRHISSNTHPDANERDIEICSFLQEHNIDWVVLAGYMKKVGEKTLTEFAGRIVNIHPSLLPKYGGQGMYGMHVHEAVLAAGEIESGVTIHHVTSDYDEGSIILQESVPVLPDDTPETLAASVLQLEHRLYTKALEQLMVN